MDELVQLYLGQALAPATQCTYNSAQTRYIQFCAQCQLTPLPATEPVLCGFAAVLAAQGVAHKTLKGYLSAIRYLHITRLGQDPQMTSMVTLQYTLRGIKRVQSTSGSNRPRPRLPITSAIMKTLKKSWEAQSPSYNATMLWAAACTCYFGFLRSGEATVPSNTSYDPAVHLSVADVSVDSPANPKVVSIRIKASKTDPFREGVSIFLGKTTSEICPVAALLSYISVRGAIFYLTYTFWT